MKQRLVLPLAALCFFLASPVTAEDFYKGKVVRAIVSGSAGGGFDIYTRALILG
jgi:tripartite-type tricarboxylate transporter receptor subunit TctC